MPSAQESEAREHLHRSETVFIAAAVAFVFGVLSVYQSIYLVLNLGTSGLRVPTAPVVIWAFCLFGFVAAVWATAVISRNARTPGR